jgi:uncharacterized membrane protein
MSVSARPLERDRGGARAAGQRDAREAKALARGHREAIRRRTRRIRRSVAALAVTLFAVAFLVVYVQLASGHDPALVANAAKRAASAGGGSETISSATGEASGESSASGNEGGSEESSGASALTTSQS